MHSNVTSKNVSGFTLAGPPCNCEVTVATMKSINSVNNWLVTSLHGNILRLHQELDKEHLMLLWLPWWLADVRPRGWHELGVTFSNTGWGSKNWDIQSFTCHHFLELPRESEKWHPSLPITLLNVNRFSEFTSRLGSRNGSHNTSCASLHYLVKRTCKYQETSGNLKRNAF